MKEYRDILLMVACTLLLIYASMEFLSYDQSFYESKIGSQIIINNDTLVIVNYSSLFNEYSLSNGVKINRAFVKMNDY